MRIFPDAGVFSDQPPGGRQMKRVRSAMLLINAVLLTRGAESQQTKKRPSPEQMRFGLEQSVDLIRRRVAYLVVRRTSFVALAVEGRNVELNRSSRLNPRLQFVHGRC